MFTMPGFVGGEYADIIIRNVTIHNHRIYHCNVFTDIGEMMTTMVLNVTGELLIARIYLYTLLFLFFFTSAISVL